MRPRKADTPCALRAAQEVRETKTAASTGSSDGAEEIYLGFDKYDTQPRAGRKGKVIKDDPRKYPAKEDMGFFLGVVGGWAGGEAAIVKIKEEAEVGHGARGACLQPCWPGPAHTAGGASGRGCDELAQHF